MLSAVVKPGCASYIRKGLSRDTTIILSSGNINITFFLTVY